MPLFGKKEEKAETIGEKIRSPEEKAEAERLSSLITYPDFGTIHFMKKDCPNASKCFAITSHSDKVMAHQLCAVCTMLQQLIIIRNPPLTKQPGSYEKKAKG